MDRRTFLAEGIAVAAGAGAAADTLAVPRPSLPACHRLPIAVLAELQFAPGTGRAAADALMALALATVTEQGCGRYVVSQDLTDPDRFHLSELWDDRDALVGHFSTPHMAAFSATARGLGYAAPFLKQIHVAGLSDLKPAEFRPSRRARPGLRGTESC